jgi:flagellar assembly protein FliH
MKATAKYLFDEDFASGDRPTITMVEHERRRADAESQAYRNGFAAAQAQAHTDAEQRIAVALGRLADGLEQTDRSLAAIETRLENEAIEVAIAVAAKLAPALIACEPFAEIAALATECFRHLATTPHMVVRIGADIYEAGKAKLDEIAQARGFEGRLVVMAEADIAPGDCRIEWADGGVNRDRIAIKNAIGDVVGRYMAARTAH